MSIKTEKLVFGYKNPLFSPLDFYSGSGNITAILGANGSGKTAFLHTIIGLLPVLAGRVSITEPIAFVPQFFSPQFSYTVLDMTLMGRASWIELLSLPNKEDETAALRALALLGIAHLADRPYNTLSGGQRQMVLIARALAGNASAIALDEPASALDMRNQESTLKLLKRLSKQEDKTILFTTHDPSHAWYIADNTLLFMPDLHWIFGKTAEVLTEEHLTKAYSIPIKYIPQAGYLPIFDI
ncbi:MAG: ABC transporter ATP-binding protein [Spirochaetaceae bacterium]|jgi:iron complex transport system ATP-binding protein|nr:ABC transporter ATP-binding protein [Spirochaetaceae bacterium]